MSEQQGTYTQQKTNLLNELANGNLKGGLWLRGKLTHSIEWVDKIGEDGNPIMVERDGVMVKAQKAQRTAHARLIRKDGTLYGYQYELQTKEKINGNWQNTRFIIKMFGNHKLSFLGDDVNAEVQAMVQIPKNGEVEWKEKTNEINGVKTKEIIYTFMTNSYGIERLYTNQQPKAEAKTVTTTAPAVVQGNANEDLPF